MHLNWAQKSNATIIARVVNQKRLQHVSIFQVRTNVWSVKGPTESKHILNTLDTHTHKKKIKGDVSWQTKKGE